MSAAPIQRQTIRHSGQGSYAHRAAGFIQGVLLFGIALLAVVIAAFSFSNKSTTNSTEAEEAKTIASTIITHGGAIKTAVDRFRIDRGDLLNMDFTATAPNGLFNPTDNLIRTLTIQPRGFATGVAPALAAPTATQNGHFYLRRPAAGAITIGGTIYTHLLSATGLSERTCQRINTNLHGSAMAGAPPAPLAGAVADFQGTGTAAITVPVSATSFSGVLNLEEGCVGIGAAPNTNYVYFKVLAR